jgi:hypothetical protein
MENVYRLHRPQSPLHKDPFPLSRIDKVVDSTAGSTLLCFLDCYSGYH